MAGRLDHSGFSDKTSPCGDHADQLSEERKKTGLEPAFCARDADRAKVGVGCLLLPRRARSSTY